MLWVPGWAQDRLLLLQQQLLTDCPLKQSCIHTGPSTAAGEPQAYKSSSKSRASGSLNKHSNRSVWGSDSAITWVRVRVRFFNEWCAKFCVFFSLSPWIDDLHHCHISLLILESHCFGEFDGGGSVQSLDCSKRKRISLACLVWRWRADACFQSNQAFVATLSHW